MRQSFFFERLCVKVTDARVTLIMALLMAAGNLQRNGAIPTTHRPRPLRHGRAMANGKPVSLAADCIVHNG